MAAARWGRRRRVSTASSAASAFDDAVDDEEEGYSLLPMAIGGPVSVLGSQYYRGVHRWWKGFDDQYMKPVFGGSAPVAGVGAAAAAAAAAAHQRWLDEGEYGLEEEEEEGEEGEPAVDGLLWSSSNASELEDEEVQELTEREQLRRKQKQPPPPPQQKQPPQRSSQGPTPPQQQQQQGQGQGQGGYQKVRTSSLDSVMPNPRGSPVHHRSGRVSPG